DQHSSRRHVLGQFCQGMVVRSHHVDDRLNCRVHHFRGDHQADAEKEGHHVADFEVQKKPGKKDQYQHNEVELHMLLGAEAVHYPFAGIPKTILRAFPPQIQYLVCPYYLQGDYSYYGFICNSASQLRSTTDNSANLVVHIALPRGLLTGIHSRQAPWRTRPSFPNAAVWNPGSHP